MHQMASEITLIQRILRALRFKVTIVEKKCAYVDTVPLIFIKISFPTLILFEFFFKNSTK